jgi:VCBS repeat-containing protein
MKAAGFPASVPHTTGYRGLINGAVYGQQPSGILQAFSNNGSPQDHGRIFGAAPAEDGQGYVWTGAFSTEGSSHQYLSFDDARNDLAAALVASGAATRLEDVNMGNAGVTGDHDGHAVVLQLAPSPPNAAPTATVKPGKPSRSTGKVTGKVTAVDPEDDKLTYTGMTTAKGTVTVTSRGSFTYTPTVGARHAAAATTATAGDKSDTFSITVTDAAGGVTTVPVTVTVVPKNAAPSTKVTVGTADALDGTVIGRVAVTDADGDVATFSSPHPASGPVAFNDDGTFTYQPSDAARQEARARGAIGSETFAVTVDDGHGGRKTVNVTVPIAPTDEAPIAGELEFDTRAAGTGVVKGSLQARDPDDDAFAFSGSTKTSKGTVSVSRKGTFTYTPTAAARRAAASATATDDDKTDTFFITVTDEFGAVTKQIVVVPILGKA